MWILPSPSPLADNHWDIAPWRALAEAVQSVSVQIGTAGWSIRREQQALFGAGASHLARYATRFNAVEINSSFYRPHRRGTYERWAASVPEDFRFAVKLPRSITHNARLKGAGDLLDAFLEQVAGLGEKLGPLLVQLPPSLAFEPQVAAEFFGGLREKFAGALACEPRHAGWFGSKANALLKKHRIARVAADPAPVPGAGEPGGWDGFRYFRWHGSPVMYRSDYPPQRLAGLASRLKTGDWCIFDNTADGAAMPNALRVDGTALARCGGGALAGGVPGGAIGVQGIAAGMAAVGDGDLIGADLLVGQQEIGQHDLGARGEGLVAPPGIAGAGLDRVGIGAGEDDEARPGHRRRCGRASLHRIVNRDERRHWARLRRVAANMGRPGSAAVERGRLGIVIEHENHLAARRAQGRPAARLHRFLQRGVGALDLVGGDDLGRR